MTIGKELDRSPYFQAIGHVRVIARLLHDHSIALAIADGNMDGLTIGQNNRHLGRVLAPCQQEHSSQDSSRGTGARGETALQGVEIRKELLYSTPKAMRAIDREQRSSRLKAECSKRQLRTLDDKDADAPATGCLHLLLKTATETALFRQDGLRTETGKQGIGVVLFIVDKMVFGKLSLLGHLL